MRWGIRCPVRILGGVRACRRDPDRRAKSLPKRDLRNQLPLAWEAGREPGHSSAAEIEDRCLQVSNESLECAAPLTRGRGAERGASDL